MTIFDEVLGKEVPVHRKVTPEVEKEIVLKEIEPEIPFEVAIKEINEKEEANG